MSYWFLVSLPPLVVALAYGRAPFFAWYGVGLIWLAALAGMAGWSPAPVAVVEDTPESLRAEAFEAAQWAIEQGYLKARADGSFKPDKGVAKWRVIRGYRAVTEP